MRVIQLNHFDINGGAARAAYRIHHALRGAGIDSRMWVNRADAGDWTVQEPTRTIEKLVAAVRPGVGAQIRHLVKTANRTDLSFNTLPSCWRRLLNRSDADLVHLHWVGAELLSIADIGRIRKPVIWTLHDMWAFCGAEHYSDDERWRTGYRKDNRPQYEGGMDVNRWTWLRKRKYWLKPMHIVTPSRWLAACVRDSALMRDWPVTVIANPIDTGRWRPLPQALARELLGLPPELPLLLFGAIGGGRSPRKGFDLLLKTLEHLRGEPRVFGMELVVFGQLAPKTLPDLGFPIHYTGHVHDDLSLRALYSAADALMLPSRQDNLPNTGVEALACGTPVVAFNTGGLPDIVEHQRIGYLANAFDPEDLAVGIRWVLDNTRNASLRQNARARAVDQFSYPVVAEQYRDIYRQICQSAD